MSSSTRDLTLVSACVAVDIAVELSLCRQRIKRNRYIALLWHYNFVRFCVVYIIFYVRRKDRPHEPTAHTVVVVMVVASVMFCFCSIRILRF